MKFYRKMRVRRFQSIKVYAADDDEMKVSGYLAEFALLRWKIWYNIAHGIDYEVMRHERDHALTRTNPLLFFHHRNSPKRRRLWIEARGVIAGSYQGGGAVYIRDHVRVIARVTGNSPTLSAEYLKRQERKVRDRGPIKWVK